MAEVLTVVEHEAIPVVHFRTSERKELGQKHATLLEKLEKKLSAKAWYWGNKEIKFASHCGVISVGALSIEIIPKIYGVDAEDRGSSSNALIRFLSKARRLKLHEVGPAGISPQKRNLLDIFILHFCERLRIQLMRGMIRKYIKREKNLNVLRGKLRIDQQLRRNLIHQERLFCRYDELSTDNAYNKILKYVLGILLKAATGNRALREVSELHARFESVTDSVADISTLDSLSFDRLTERYEPIFDQCRYFLEGLYPDVVAGKKSCLSLLFDMNRLFEAYVASELRKEANIQGLRLREQGPLKYFAKLDGSGEPVFRMKPDISFVDKKNQVVMIADTKWKMLDEREKNLGISQADMYQMGSYASRYGVKCLALLYPMQEKLTESVYMTLEGTEVTLLVQPVDISAQITLPLWHVLS
ncbi:MAG: restriction endonuclease [Candidatus Dadabacteria bacterium]|nr:restriction endonuclease [Candidatus Dadabacteria bacterium]